MHVSLWNSGEDQKPRAVHSCFTLCSVVYKTGNVEKCLSAVGNTVGIGNMPKQADTQTADRDDAVIK